MQEHMTAASQLRDTADAHACDELASVLGEVLRHGDPARVRRVVRLGRSVRFRVGDGARGVALALDHDTPFVDGDSEEVADVDVQLTVAQASVLARGRLPLPAAIVCGQVQATGDIRAYLEIDVILQGLLAEARLRAGEHGTTSVPDTAVKGELSTPDSSLLAVETRDLHKRFGRQRVLAGADLRIPEGGISVVLGPSGTGKSVLLQHIIGLMRPDRGDVLIRGRSLASMSRSDILGLRREIGVMFQDGALFSASTVYDNVAFPLREHTDLEDAQIDHVVRARLADVGLQDATDRFPGQLSGGMRKRAGLARALALDPSIVLCDEPDSGLDPVRTALLADLLVEQHANVGGTMIVVTHNIALARHVADHITVLWQGQVRQSGMAHEIFESDDPFVRQFLSGDSVGPLSMG